MKTRQRARQITTTLLLAAALVIPGCKSPLHNRDLMVDKPKTPVVLRDAQDEVKSPKRALDVVPVVIEKKDAEGGVKKEIVYPHLKLKDRKRVTPNLEFK